MKKIILLTFISVLIFSCKKNLPDVGGTAAEKIANEWWVTFEEGGVNLLGGNTHAHIATYNTSANNNEIWVDDQQHLWEFKVKAQVNYDNLTFTANSAANEYYPITVKLTNGKVLLGAGRSKTGNVTDSIYMQAEFSDDPGNVYTIKGHARTRFSEDEY